MTHREREVRTLFHDISRMRALMFDRLIATHGLTMSQAWVLAHLFEEDNLIQSDIAKRMHVGTVTIGGLIDRLEARGLVRRRTDKVDRRAKRVSLTEAAIPLGRVMRRCEIKVRDATYAGVSRDDQEKLFTLLFVIRDNLREAVKIGAKAVGESADAT